MKNYHVVIAGATGAVGAELLNLLSARDFPLASLRLLASPRSAGKTLPFGGENLQVEVLSEETLRGADIAFFSAGGSRSKEFAPAAVEMGSVVIDNSSAFRMTNGVPLVIPEVNGEDALTHRGIIANPNCSTIILLMVLAPLHRLSPIRRVVVSTYQAASGAGAQAILELESQSRAVLENGPIVKNVFPHQIAFNLFSHNTAIGANGYNEEEMKMVNETRKILHEPDFALSATCVRVPVSRAHSESVNVEFAASRPPLAAIREALQNFPGVRVIDDRENNVFPMPIDASHQNEVFVGRLRDDISCPNALDLFVSGDQILKGAALNAVQIAEHLVQKNAVKGAMEAGN